MQMQNHARFILRNNVMRGIIASSLLLLMSLTSTAQWAVQTENDGDILNLATGKAIASDNNGNVYVLGDFENTLNIAGQTYTAVEGRDLFLAKYNGSGNFQWVNTIKSAGKDVAEDLHVTSGGTIYMTATFNDSIQFGNNWLQSKGRRQMCLAKYDASGNLQWATQNGVPTQASGRADPAGIGMDNQGDIYVGGYYLNDIVFGTDTLDSQKDGSVFVVKYSQTGNPLWSSSSGRDPLPSSSSEVIRVQDFEVNGSGQCYVTGYYKSSFLFGTDSLFNVQQNNKNPFLAHFNQSGQFQWAIQGREDNKDAFGNRVAIDANGNAYCGSSYKSQISWGGKSVSRSRNDPGMCLTKVSSNGSVEWVRDVENGALNHAELYPQVYAKSNGDVYVYSDYFSLLSDYNFGNGVTLGSDQIGGFIAKYSSGGNAQSAFVINSSSMNAYDLQLNNSDQILMTGEFLNSVSFSFATLSNGGAGNMFAVQTAQYPPQSYTSIGDQPNDKATLASQRISSGYHLSLEEPKNRSQATLRLYNLKGEIVHQEQFLEETEVNMTTLASGIYLAEVITEEQRYVQKLVW